MLLVLDEADAVLVDATMAIVAAECAGADRLDDALVERWLGHRNDVSALEALTAKGFVVDTMEIAAPVVPASTRSTTARSPCSAVPHTLAATAHLSHSYPDGACLYFTFAARPPADEREATYVALWDAGTRAVLAARRHPLSHHHGVGLNRGRFVADALGPAFDVLVATKQALDPHGHPQPGQARSAVPVRRGAVAGAVQRAAPVRRRGMISS